MLAGSLVVAYKAWTRRRENFGDPTTRTYVPRVCARTNSWRSPQEQQQYSRDLKFWQSVRYSSLHGHHSSIYKIIIKSSYFSRTRHRNEDTVTSSHSIASWGFGTSRFPLSLGCCCKLHGILFHLSIQLGSIHM